MILDSILMVDPLEGEFTGSLEIEDGKISRVSKKKRSWSFIVIPGFFDPHVHGSFGADTMDLSKKSLEKMEEFFYAQGVTSFLPTTVSCSLEDMLKALDVVEEYMNGRDVTSVLGVHLEGPYISPEKVGAQNPEYVRKPSEKEINALLERDVLRLITMAPEIEGFSEYSKTLMNKGVVISMGHSNAKFEHVKKAYDMGVKRITHFPNALRPLHHREIGITGAGLYFDDIVLELICDGVHLSPQMVKLVYKTKGADRIILITDAISAAGLKDGVYELGGLRVFVENGVARLSNGSLAGSTLTFINAVRNFRKFTGASLKELTRVSSYNAILNLSIENLGRIKEGYIADLVVLDRDLNLIATVKRGEVVYGKIS